MKKLIVLLTMLSCTSTFGQQIKSNKALIKVPKVKNDVRIDELTPAAPNTISENDNCFLFIQEELKDSLIYVTENLLEYGKNGNKARMIISTSNYDPIKKREAEEQRMILIPSEERKLIIDGTYRIYKGVLTFDSLDEDINKKRTFKLVYKPNTKVLNYLRDHNSNKYSRGKCLEKTLNIGM